jgi:signal transduction histidine kinase
LYSSVEMSTEDMDIVGSPDTLVVTQGAPVRLLDKDIDGQIHDLKNPLAGIWMFLEYIKDDLPSLMGPTVFQLFSVAKEALAFHTLKGTHTVEDYKRFRDETVGNLNLIRSYVAGVPKEGLGRFTSRTIESMLLLLEPGSQFMKNVEQLAAKNFSFTVIKEENFDLSKLVSDVVAEFQGLGKASIRFESEGDLSSFFGDPRKLRQVLENLIKNSLDHGVRNKREEGVITVRAQRLNGTVNITVQDNGVGISPQNLPKVFQHRFTTGGAHGNSGLGLDNCLQIVRAHGGDITVNSNESEGATFTVQLPITFYSQTGNVLILTGQVNHVLSRIENETIVELNYSPIVGFSEEERNALVKEMVRVLNPKEKNNISFNFKKEMTIEDQRKLWHGLVKELEGQGRKVNFEFVEGGLTVKMTVDSAMDSRSTNTGGIDLNSVEDQLQTKGTGTLYFDPAAMQTIDVRTLSPRILDMEPLVNLSAFMNAP